jgi:hypothetical protein
VAFIGPLVGFWLKLAGACGRVDGIIETCKIETIIILKIHPRPCGTRINKQQTNKQTNKHSIFSNCHIIGLDNGSLVLIVFGKE